MFDGWGRSLRLLRARPPPKLFNSPTCCEPCHLLGRLSLHCRPWHHHQIRLRLTRIARAQQADTTTRTCKIPVDNDGHVRRGSLSLHHRRVLCQHCRHCTTALLPTMPSLHRQADNSTGCPPQRSRGVSKVSCTNSFVDLEICMTIPQTDSVCVAGSIIFGI